ncbi:MAG: biotin-dependent carboxyltransferase family protein [Ramlibacter sp.]|nr:biotin-dependent carboxyltransferase family protein [Ramlibacter sp.]
MSEARLTVRSCGPLVSYQDAGRFGMARYGVPASGPMDRFSHAVANAALGRAPGATAIEVSTGGLELVCERGAVTCCITGGEFQVMHSGAKLESWCVRTLHEGDVVAVRAGARGSWAYLAFAGELACTTWAGSAATHSASGLGAGMLAAGQSIVVRDAQVADERDGPLPVPTFDRPSGVVRVVAGSQEDSFEPESKAAFLEQPFTFTPAFDRMGVRLAGPKLLLRDALSIPSEPIVRGAVQVAGDGVASILLADHQTTGGYPKIATIVSADLDGVAQLRPGDRVRFEPVSPVEAIALARAHAKARSRFLGEVAVPRGSLQDRLMRENLISGVSME